MADRSIRPVSPDEIEKAKRRSVPVTVIEKINKILSEMWDGHKVWIDAYVLGDGVDQNRLAPVVIEMYKDAGWFVKFESGDQREGPALVFSRKRLAL